MKYFKRLLLIGLAALPLAAWAQDHVLVMTISNYPVQPLDGVVHDASNALILAQRLGYDTRHAQQYKNTELAGQGIVQALNRLEAMAGKDDRVFVYYSGHGTSVLKQGICEQALVAQDGQYIGMDDLHPVFNRLRDKVRDIVVVLDSCYSGGMGNLLISTPTRSPKGGGTHSAWKSKLWEPKDGEQCKPSINRVQNVSKQWITRDMTPPEARMVLVAAANEREAALDDSRSGGLATSALVTCAKSGIRDTDSSGAINFTELRDCAQLQLNRTISQDGRGYSVHHIEVWGNSELAVPLSLAATPPTPAMPSPADAVQAAFRELERNSDVGWGLNVDVKMPVVKLGQNGMVDFKLTQPGYVYLLYVGASRTHMKQMYPAPGESVRVQQESFEIGITAPTGDNLFLLIATEQPYDFSEIFKKGGAAKTTNHSVRSLSREALFRDASYATMGKKTVVDGRPRLVARTFVIRGE